MKSALTVNVEEHRLLQRWYEMRIGRPAFVRSVTMLPSQLRYRQLADDDALIKLLDSTVYLLAVHQPVHLRRGFPFCVFARKSTEIICG